MSLEERIEIAEMEGDYELASRLCMELINQNTGGNNYGTDN